MISRRWEVLFLLAVSVVGSGLFLANLGNAYLWQDEAQTALIAQTVLQHGLPKGHDEKNSFSQELGIDVGKNDVWRWHPWLAFYVVAPFLELLGTTTFAARLPFALFGLGCVPLLYLLSRALWKDGKIAALSAGVLLVSVPFLLLARQCRYYSLAAFFLLGGLYGYVALVERRRSGPYLYLICAVLLCHANYVNLIVLLAAVGLHTLVFHRDQWRRVAGWSLGVVLLTAPWIIWFSSIHWGQTGLLDVKAYAFRLLAFLRPLNTHVFPVWLLLIPLSVALWSKLRRYDIPFWKEDRFLSRLSLPVLLVGINLLALPYTAPGPYFRYLGPLIPLACMVIALFARWAMRIHWVIGLVILGAVIARSPVRSYLYEVTHDFDGPIEGIVRYLNEHAQEGDTVAITYGDLPVKFYTKLRVYGGLTGEDLTPALDADWIIIRRNIVCPKDHNVSAFLRAHVDGSKYERIALSYPDTRFENREDPDSHFYRTQTDVPPVVIWRKRTAASQSVPYPP